MKKINLIVIFTMATLFSQAQNSPNKISGSSAPKMILMEESCAKDCGGCFFHCMDKINALYAANKNKIAMVVYNQAPIGIGLQSEPSKPFWSFYSTFNIDYQSLVLMNRTYFPNNYDPTQGPTSETVDSELKAYQDLLNDKYSPVNIKIENTFNPSTRDVSVKLTANFCDTATGDLRIYLVLTQDTVKGPKGGYDYAQNISGSVGQTTHGFQITEQTTPGGMQVACVEAFPFINPIKYVPSGFFGNSGVIPSKPVQGTDYVENYSFKLPLRNSTMEKFDIDPRRIQIIAAVVRKGVFKKRQVLNANKKYLIDNTTSIDEMALTNLDFSVTTLVHSTLHFTCKGKVNGRGELKVFNASGELVKSLANIEYGESPVENEISVSDLAEGIYFASFKTSDGTYNTRKFVIAR